MNNPSKYTETLAMHFESPWDHGTNIAQIYRGWFTAPVTSRYRFMTACDDYCAMRLGITPG